MAELNPDRQSPMNPAEAKVKRPTPSWARVAIALVLSALFPGAGQLYNRQPRKGLLMIVALILIVVVEGASRSFTTFRGFLFHLLLWGGGIVLVLIHACRTAWIGEHEEEPFRHQRITFAIFGVVIICLASLPAFDWFRNRFLYIKAFRVPSASMCPTICEEERMIADMAIYKHKGPKRGDIILMQFKNEKALFTKRIVGVGGDTVESGPGGSFLVNGKPVSKPEICGQPTVEKNHPEEAIIFDPVQVPEGLLFVIGDNLNNSFDTRTPRFGYVSPSQVRGKPLFLYWSPAKSRIGCPIR